MKSRNTLKISQSQATSLPAMEHKMILIPATSQPSWAGYSIFDIKEKMASIHEVTIRLNVSAISGLTGTNTACYTPTFFWLQRCEMVINNNIIDTVYPVEQFLRNQLFQYDEDRKYTNLLCGDYSSTTTRIASATAANDYYIPLWSIFKQTHLTLINNAHEVQLRCYWDTALNNISSPSMTGTAISTINSGVLLVKLSRHTIDTINLKSKSYSSGFHAKFSELRTSPFIVTSGTATTSIVLTPIVGPVAFLMFVVRNTASLSGSNYWNFQAIKDFSILNSSSTNITGGVQITHTQAIYLLNKDYVLSSYTTETGANVYIFAFTGSPTDTITTGRSYGVHHFKGNEQLLINFNTTLTQGVQVDVFAYVDSAIEISNSYVKKIQTV